MLWTWEFEWIRVLPQERRIHQSLLLLLECILKLLTEICFELSLHLHQFCFWKSISCLWHEHFQALEQVPTHHSSQTDSALHALTQPNSHLEGPLLPFLGQIAQDSSDMLHDWLTRCFIFWGEDLHLETLWCCFRMVLNYSWRWLLWCGDFITSRDRRMDFRRSKRTWCSRHRSCFHS